jgi:threonine dehydratase
MPSVEAPTLAEVRAARERLDGLVLRTPLVRLHVDDAPAEIHLKLECLQPIGSFKIRGATNAMALAGAEALREGVYTASAGNMAQGVAWAARRRGLTATAIVPEHAPEAKLSALARLGTRVEKVPFDAWWQVLVDHGQPDRKGLFIHPVSNRAVMAGNGTIGRRLLDGALSSPLADVAAAVRLLAERAHVVSEGAGAASLAAALSGRAGRGKTVCVVSGGNIDARVLGRILSGEAP